jgi:glycosyltransferase involved in cell wall biosynthesis
VGVEQVDQERSVTAVIPTRNRPGLLTRAVRSALAQTHRNLDVVVVIDGPDEATAAALHALADPRVTIVPLLEGVGGSEARNIGARAAKGEWIALLDDDDEWLPTKLARQFAALTSLDNNNVILSSKYTEQFISEFYEHPTRLLRSGESIASYLCCPRGVRYVGENIQTSTLVFPKSLILTVPFISGLKRGQDFMWLVQVASKAHATLHIVPEVLSVFHSDDSVTAPRVSTVPNWRSLHACIRKNKDLFTPEAYNYCIATRILNDAIKCKEPVRVKFTLLWEILKSGSAAPKCLLVFFYVWLIPQATRSHIGQASRHLRRHTMLLSSQAGSA